jgi:plasmid stability protein
MGQILVRNIDDGVLDALRGRAGQRGSSVEEEARRALAESVGLSREEAARRLDVVRAKISRLMTTPSLDDLRIDRRRDDEPKL